MANKKMKKLLSLFMVLVMTVGVFTINVSAFDGIESYQGKFITDEVKNDDEPQNTGEFPMQEYQMGAIESVLNRSSGLVAFEGVNLDSEEMIPVIVEFVHRPEAVQSAVDKIMGNNDAMINANRPTLQSLAAQDRNAFMADLPQVLSDSATGYSPNLINFVYDTALNGMALSIPANKVMELMELNYVQAVYYDLEFMLDPEKDSVYVPVSGGKLYDGFTSEDVQKGGLEPETDLRYRDEKLALPADPSQNDDEPAVYGMDTVRAFLGVDEVYNDGITGDGILVGILDTGVDYYHPDLIDAYLDQAPDGNPAKLITITLPSGEEVTKFFGYDVVGQETAYKSTYAQLPARASIYDPYEMSYLEWMQTSRTGNYAEIGSNGNYFYTSHGSHVAGIIAGQGKNTEVADGYLPQLGIAPGAKLITYRVLGPYGSGVGSAITRAIDMVPADGVDVVNMSLGNTLNNPNYVTSIAVNNIVLTYGIVFCLSAGNSGPNLETLGSPAAGAAAITLGSVQLVSFNTAANRIQLSTGDGTADAYVLNMFPASTFVKIDGTNKYRHTASTLMEPDANGEYECVFVPNYGAAADYTGLNVTGKIAVVTLQSGMSGTNPMTLYQALYAYNAGAGALILVDTNNSGGSYPYYSTQYTNVVSNFAIPYANAAAFRSALIANGMKVSITSTYDLIKGASLANSSSRGPVAQTQNIKPEIVTPGVAIYSSVAYYDNDTDTPWGDYSGAYALYSGTSMASPMAAGLVAILLSQDIANNGEKTMEPEEVKARLANSADRTKLDSVFSYSVYEVGSGVPNIGKSLNSGAYFSVLVHNFSKRTGGLDSSAYEMVDGRIQALLFGSLRNEEGASSTITATVHNPSDTARTYSVSYEWNNGGQGVHPTHSGNVVPQGPATLVAEPGNTDFDLSVVVGPNPSELDITNANRSEGYILFTDLDSGEVLRLPFVFKIGSTQPILKEAFLNKPIMSTNVGDQNVAMSANSTLWVNFGRVTETGTYLKLYVAKAEGFNYDNPTSSFIGVVPNYVNLASAYTPQPEGSYYTVAGFFPGYYFAYDAPGAMEMYYDDYVYVEDGHYIITLMVCKDTYGWEPVYDEGMIFMDLYVDNSRPEIVLTGRSASNRYLEGYVNDPQALELANLHFEFKYSGIFSSHRLMEVVAVVDDMYYTEAMVLSDGRFSVDLGALRPLTAARTTAPVYNYPITDSTSITLFVFDGYERMTGTMSPVTTGFGYNTDKTNYWGVFSFATLNASGVVTNAYAGNNFDFYKFTMGEQPVVDLSAYNGMVLEVGDIKGVYPREINDASVRKTYAASLYTNAESYEVNDMARIYGYSLGSSDTSVIYVDGDNVVRAVGEGTAYILAYSRDVVVGQAEVTVLPSAVAADVSAGVTLNRNSYVFFGAARQPATHNYASYGQVTRWETDETPVLWRVMGNETTPEGVEDYLTIMNRNTVNTMVPYNNHKMSARYFESDHQQWLNEQYTRAFAWDEDGVVPYFDVTTGYYWNSSYNPASNDLHMFAPDTNYNQKVYPLMATYLPGDSFRVYWSASDNPVAANEITTTTDRYVYIKGASAGCYQLTRSTVIKTTTPGVQGISASGGTYTDSLTEPDTMRALTKIMPDKVVYAYPVIAGGIPAEGTYPSDSVNYLVPAGLTAYKLTVLGKSNGASVGTVAFEDIVSYKNTMTINGLTSSAFGDDYVVAFKAVNEEGAIVRYGEVPAQSYAQDITFTLDEVVNGQLVDVYVWLQKNYAVNSNVAGTVEVKQVEVYVPVTKVTVNFPGVSAVNVIFRDVTEQAWRGVEGVFDNTVTFDVPGSGTFTIQVAKGGMLYTFNNVVIVEGTSIELDVPVLPITVTGLLGWCYLGLTQSENSVYIDQRYEANTDVIFNVFNNGNVYALKLRATGLYPLTISSIPAGDTVNISTLFSFINVPTGVRDMLLTVGANTANAMTYSAQSALEMSGVALLMDGGMAHMSFYYYDQFYEIDFVLDGTDPFAFLTGVEPPKGGEGVAPGYEMPVTVDPYAPVDPGKTDPGNGGGLEITIPGGFDTDMK